MPEEPKIERNYKIPIVRASWLESLIFIHNMPDTKMCYFMGIGVVKMITKGKDFDVIKVMFGITNKCRDVIVYHTRARRQILTLKTGQYGLFYGTAKLSYSEIPREGQTPYYKKQYSLMAYMVQGMYVPTMFDVKKDIENEIEHPEEYEHIHEMEQGTENLFKDVIDSLLDLSKVFKEGDDE